MNKHIEYTSVERQIEKLKLQGLIIDDEEAAQYYLELYGYSNLIKSYRDPYVFTSSEGQKKYRNGIIFEQILSLYSFDKNLRNAVMASMLDLEEHIKEIAADIIAQSFGIQQDKYLQFHNYKDKKRKKEQFTLAGTLRKLNNALQSDKDPIRHYRSKYDNVPPWILFRNIYFSTIINFINLFKPTQQLAVAKRLYRNNNPELSPDSLRKLMMDTLFLCQEYRNLSAHGGRIYNYKHHSKVRTKEIFPADVNINTSGFNGLLYLLSLFRYKSPYSHLKKSLEYNINKHCSIFPQDITYLEKTLNINFNVKNYVFITKSSKKFHTNQHCSGIKNAERIEYNKAISNGYVPCKKCVSDQNEKFTD